MARSSHQPVGREKKIAKNSIKDPKSLIIALRGKKQAQVRTVMNDRINIQRLHLMNKSISEISRQVGLARATVRKWIASPTFETSHHKAGRPRTVNDANGLAVVKQVYEEKINQPLTNIVALALARRANYRGSSVRSLRDAKKELKIKTIKASFKPARALWPENRKKREKHARVRLRWTKAQRKGIIWIDESEGQIQPIRQRWVMAGDDRCHRDPIAPTPDKKDEKVHFLIAFGNGFKSFEHLPLRRAVVRNDDGVAIRPKGDARRKRGAPGNKQLNLANEGKTWNADGLLAIFKDWYKDEKFRSCYGVVLDNARPHAKVADWLRSKNIFVIDHPPHSPDFNVCEQIHQTVKQRAKNEMPINNHELLAAYKKVFNDFDADTFLDKYLDKYPAIMREVLAKRGLPTKY